MRRLQNGSPVVPVLSNADRTLLSSEVSGCCQVISAWWCCSCGRTDVHVLATASEGHHAASSRRRAS